MKKQLTAGAICFGILYAVDAMFFDGWYFVCANQALERAWALRW
jgi:hypothetical protein